MDDLLSGGSDGDISDSEAWDGLKPLSWAVEGRGGGVDASFLVLTLSSPGNSTAVKVDELDGTWLYNERSRDDGVSVESKDLPLTGAGTSFRDKGGRNESPRGGNEDASSVFCEEVVCELAGLKEVIALNFSCNSSSSGDLRPPTDLFLSLGTSPSLKPLEFVLLSALLSGERDWSLEACASDLLSEASEWEEDCLSEGLS